MDPELIIMQTWKTGYLKGEMILSVPKVLFYTVFRSDKGGEVISYLLF